MTIAVESAVEQKPFAEWLEQDYDYVRPRRGNVQEGVIVSMEEDEAIVHLPEAKRDGLVYGNDLDRLDEEYREALDVGTHVPVRILKGITRDGQIVVSIRQGLDYQDWLRAEELVESGETVECEIIGENKGGLVVSFGRLRGFVPNSHLQRGRSRRREDKAEMAGETVTLVVLEVEQRRRRLVMSERGAHTQQRQKLLQELEEGQILQGKVSNLTDYGAFVDLGGLDGLVHISELDWRFTEHPSEVLSEGDELEVYVLGVDRERERVSLSRKRAIPNPFHKITEHLLPGDSLLGTVARLTSYGAFIDIGSGVEGLLHVSDMPDGTLSGLESGAELDVRITNIDREKQRISLAIPTGFVTRWQPSE